MDTHTLMAELGQRMGLADLALDGEGRAAFRSSDGLHVEMHGTEDDTAFYMMTPIGQLRDEQPSALLLEMLHQNAAASGVGTPFFGLEESTREIVLAAQIPSYLLTTDAVEKSLQALIARAITERARWGGEGLQIN